MRWPREIGVGLLLTYALALYGALGGLPGQPEHEAHLFLASHYFSSYFDLWDGRWYGGFSVGGHPPLVHQLVGLLGRLPGLGIERAYAAMTVVAALSLVAGCAAFIEQLSEPPAPFAAALLVAAYPYLYLFLFPFGQLAFIAAMALGLLAAAALLQGLRSRGGRMYAAASLLAVAALAAHPLGILPLALGWGLALRCALKAPAGRSDGRRLLLAGAAAAAGALLGLWPFWTLLQDPNARSLPMGKQGWGALALGAALIVATSGLAAWRDRRFGATALGLALLALGLFDGVPTVAWDKWIWLAGLAGILGLAASLRGTPYAAVLAMAGAACLVVPISMILGEHGRASTLPRRRALAEVSAFLERPGNERWRYVTLGIGNERLELSRRTRVGSLDGGMPWLAGEALRGTPFHSFDQLPMEQREAIEVLERVLARADAHGLRWVISGDDRATPILEKHGYRIRSAFRGSVVLWENEAVAPARVLSARPRKLAALGWGLIPPMALGLGLCLWAWERVRWRGSAPART